MCTGKVNGIALYCREYLGSMSNQVIVHCLITSFSINRPIGLNKIQMVKKCNLTFTFKLQRFFFNFR